MPLHLYPEPSKDEALIRQKVKAIVELSIRPTAIEDDEKGHFRRDVFNALGKQGLASVITPKEYGGLGLSHHCYYAVIEELARGSLAMAITTGVTNLPQGAIVRFGTNEQKQKYLPHLTTGQFLGAFSFSESHSGSDAAGLRLQAERTKGGYKLSGTKLWCTSAGFADIYLLMARTSEDRTAGITSFLVLKDTPGFRVGKIENKLGLRASPTGELIFENCFVPEDQRLGEEGQGFAIALAQLDSGRIVIAAAALGLMIEALERAWEINRKNQRSFSKGVAQHLGEFFGQVQAVKTLIAEAARCKDQKKDVTVIASQAKLVASDLAMKVTSDVVEVLGAAGVCQANEVERIMRDAKALQIVEGTNQIQRLVIAKAMEQQLRY